MYVKDLEESSWPIAAIRVKRLRVALCLKQQLAALDIASDEIKAFKRTESFEQGPGFGKNCQNPSSILSQSGYFSL